jgi:hypothetical protein
MSNQGYLYSPHQNNGIDIDMLVCIPEGIFELWRTLCAFSLFLKGGLFIFFFAAGFGIYFGFLVLSFPVSLIFWFSCGLAVSMGEATKPLFFEGFQAGCHVVLRGRRGTL